MCVFCILYNNLRTMANPLISEDLYLKAGSSENSMTLNGTISKTFFLVLLTILSAVWVWSYATLFLPFLLFIALGAFFLALVIIFAPRSAPFLAPVYAIAEGIFIGTISMFFELQYSGIVLQAVGLTFGVFLMMLFLYRTKIIQVTAWFRMWVTAATGAIAILYVISMIGYASGWYQVPYIHEGGFIGIALSVFIVGIAAFNLLLDFDNIEMWVEMQAPKHMEWYLSFGLLVTLVWLYLEILRLLSKLRD